MAIDKILLHLTKELLQKKGFVPPPDYQQQMMGMGPGAPMGAAGMQGGMPPGGGMPMDPAMMQGGMPMDPAMMQGGMPPEGMPMDPSMMGGAPPEEDPEQKAKEEQHLENRLKNLEDNSKLILNKLDLLMQEVDYTKAGSDKNVPLLWAMKQLATEK